MNFFKKVFNLFYDRKKKKDVIHLYDDYHFSNRNDFIFNKNKITEADMKFIEHLRDDLKYKEVNNFKYLDDLKRKGI